MSTWTPSETKLYHDRRAVVTSHIPVRYSQCILHHLCILEFLDAAAYEFCFREGEGKIAIPDFVCLSTAC